MAMMSQHATLMMALTLEFIDHILTFLSWPHDLHPRLFNKSLNHIAERILYRNIGELPATVCYANLAVTRECSCNAVRAPQERLA